MASPLQRVRLLLPTVVQDHRAVISLCLFVLALNFMWVPWTVPSHLDLPGDPAALFLYEQQIRTQDLRSGFLWAGPKTYSTDDGIYYDAAHFARPDFQVLFLRTLAILAFSLGAMVLGAHLQGVKATTKMEQGTREPEIPESQPSTAAHHP